MKNTGFLLAVFFLLAVTFILCSKSESPPPASGYQLRPEVEANIKESELIDLTKQLIRIRSDYDEGVVANHNEIANFLADYLRKLGMEVHVIEPEPNYPTVIGRLKGSEGTPQLGYLGHYNTVMAGDMTKWETDPWTPVYKDGRIYGLGGVDMKMHIASSLLASKAVIDAGIKLKGDLIHLYIPGEGAQTHSLPHITKSNPELLKADWYIDEEGGTSLTKNSGGWTWVKVRVTGVTGHTGGGRGDGKPGPPINAIFKMAKVLTEIQQFDNWMTYEKNPYQARPLYDGKPIVEAGKIEGGYKVNQVPDWAEAQVDIRMLPGQSPDGVLAEMRALFDRMKKEDPDLEVTVEPMTTQWVPKEYWDTLNDDDLLIKAIKEIAPAYIGKVPEWKGSLGGGRPDLWATGAKWVPFGVPDPGSEPHSPNEYGNIDSGMNRAKMFAAILLKVLE
jgi:succinyl-diaminopimelate desuccinylase